MKIAARLIKTISLILIILIYSNFLGSDSESDMPKKVQPPFLEDRSAWADSVFKTLSDDEKIAQLFMVPAFSNKGEKHTRELSKLIADYKIGGVIFMQGDPVRQAKMCNYLQSESRVPLLVSMDAEWGLAMRLDSVIKFPFQMMMGASVDNQLIYEFGAETARQLKLLGVHVNFAPVLDINNNPLNPIINIRSFGEDKLLVERKAYAYMSGMQDNRVIAVGKHFPGHGDTNKDSHKTLPVVAHSWKRLDSLELYPFKKLIKDGLGGMMIAHLFIPALDSNANTPSTLSRAVVTDLLKDELGFKGLVFTDALNMSGITKFYDPGEADAKALIAGNDVLLFSQDVPIAIQKIKEAISRGEISQKEIDKRCKKILKAKSWVGLNRYKPVKTDSLLPRLNSPKAELLYRRLVEASLTVLKNDDNIIPFRNLGRSSIVSVNIKNGETDVFQSTMNYYDSVGNISFPADISEERLNSISTILAKHDVVVVSIYSNQRSPANNFGIPRSTFDFVDNLAEKTDVVLVLLANPYSLQFFNNLSKVKAVVMGYDDTEVIQDLAAQLLFGGIPADGVLPVTACSEFPAGTGIVIPKAIRLKYTIPEDAGIDRTKLLPIDSIALDAIKEEATPGCQILVAKEGKVIYQKSFGHHTYKKKRPVDNTDLYDLASITKMVASVASLMGLYEEGKLDLNAKISKYLPYLDSTDKKDLVIKDILTHQARLTPWIPFWIKTVKDTAIYNAIYSNKPGVKYAWKVADNLYISPTYRDSIYARVGDSKLRDKKEYKYSDIGYYLMQKIIEDQTGAGLDQWVEKKYYKPLGANSLGYLPLNRFSRDAIVPTENDIRFRNQLIDGYVHDPGAAMMGGVAGHAGVFSNANDLAKIMQMFLQKGEYGGDRYYQDSTVLLFTSCPNCKQDNRRGIGFDKPEMNYDKYGPTCQCISAQSFGHSGFTGTLAWADPKEQVVFIFLSNRIHPDEENRKLIKMDVRTKIMEVIYEAIKE